MDFRKVWLEASPMLLQGTMTTMTISVIAIVIGTVIGLVLCVMRASSYKCFRSAAKIHVWMIRSTPMILQAFIIYFGLPQLAQYLWKGFTIPVYMASVITLSINSGAYLSEIFRAGINAVGRGQVEASVSLGLPQSVTMRRVVLPQAFRIILPSMVNQFVILIKDTSVLSVIGLADLMNRGRTYVGASYQFFATYTLISAYYCAIISLLIIASKCIEKRYSVCQE